MREATASYSILWADTTEEQRPLADLVGSSNQIRPMPFSLLQMIHELSHEYSSSTPRAAFYAPAKCCLPTWTLEMMLYGES